MLNASHTASKHPSWLVRKSPDADAIEKMETLLHRMKLATVCESARCPNLGECFGRGTATFMILGTTCTRRCGFCAVDHGIPSETDHNEPIRVAQAAEKLNLNHVVLTSVTRDDLPDGGAMQFKDTIDKINEKYPGARIEALVPDFKGSVAALQKVFDTCLDVFNHNIETVARLYPRVRPQADYSRSLGILEYAARQGLASKSGLMLGLGETDDEVMETLSGLNRVGCRYLTLGQYLAPTRNHLPVSRFVPPEQFDQWAETARSMGFKAVTSGPLVRSSYRAEEMLVNHDIPNHKLSNEVRGG